MGTRYLLDTNILIYLDKGINDETAANFLRIATANTILISIITEIELLGFKFSNSGDLQKMKELIADTTVLQLDRAVAEQTIEIRRNHRIILPDAIIAATALVHGLVLVTRNTGDFKNFASLVVTNPFELA